MSKEIIMQVASYPSDYPKAPIFVADLVRCKDCKHGEYREDYNDYLCHEDGISVHDAEWFCADGERREP